MIADDFQMAKKKQRRRTRTKGVNALALAESYAQLHIWSMAATNLSPWNFLTSDESGGVVGASGASTVTLKELLTKLNSPHGGGGPHAALTEGQLVWNNIKNSWVNAAISSVGVGVGFRVVSKILAKPRRMTNKLLKDMNMSSIVRV